MSTSTLPDSGTDEEPDSPRRSRWRLVLIAALVALIALAATYLVAFSPLLAARTVTVRGVRGELADRVRMAAAIDSRTPLIRLDTAGVARRVERVVVIGSARVSTSYPSTVVIEVSARVAVGVVRANSSYELVDRTGRQFRTVRVRPRRLPLFVIPAGTDARTTGEAVATVAAALPAPLRARIASIQAFDPQSITLQLADGRVVRWGSAARSAAKARIVPALLKRQGSQFDVTDPDRPFSR